MSFYNKVIKALKRVGCAFPLGVLNYVFNSEVTEEQFNNIKKQFNKFVEFDLDFTKDPIPDISEICAPPPTINYVYYDHYKNITGRFKKLVKTLPYYNSEIMYYITFIDEYLECKN